MAVDPHHGDADDLMPAVYNELRWLAAAYLRREHPGQTLQATALVHEAYLRLAGAGRPWNDRNHFLGIAARSMRQILVERAPARGAQKQEGRWRRRRAWISRQVRVAGLSTRASPSQGSSSARPRTWRRNN